jgi:quercetin dioxygenase-like cupin family protein
MIRPVTLIRWDELPLEKVTDMVARKVVSSADGTLTQAYYKRGATVPAHVESTDIIVHVLQGAMRVTVEGEDITVREGDVLVVPAGARRQVVCLDDTFVLVVSRASA